MNELERLRDELRERLPNTTSRLTAPANPDGYWTLDVVLADRWVVIEWMPPSGSFGISRVTNDTVYGEGHDEVVPDRSKALERAVALMNP